MTDLLKASADHRRRHPKAQSLTTRRKASEDTAAILRLAAAAARMAAGERERHGRPIPEADREDAAAEVAALIYGGADPAEAAKAATVGLRFACGCGYAGEHWEGDPRCAHCGGLRDHLPILADLADPDRPTMPTGDGTRQVARPRRELIAAAGRTLDRMRHENETAVAETGGLLEQSAATRDAIATRRAEEWADPTADPLPPEVAEAADLAGIWPADPLRVVLADVTGHPLAAEDLAVTPTGAGKTAAAIRKARERGAKRLALGAADPTVAALGDHLRRILTPTGEERAEAEASALAGLLASATFWPADVTPTTCKVRPTATVAAWRLLTAVRADHSARVARQVTPRPPAGGHGGAARRERTTQPVAHPLTCKVAATPAARVLAHLDRWGC